MADFYCKEHGATWFKKGKMKGYAHLIEDENGAPTGEWCNMPDDKEKPSPERKSEGYKADPEKMSSIEIQNAYTGIVSLMRCGVLERDEPIAQAALSYASSKLANWFSQGSIEEERQFTIKVENPTTEQRKRLSLALKKWDTEKAKELMINRYLTNDSKQLNKEQMEDFIAQLNQPNIGSQNKELRLEDLPF